MGEDFKQPTAYRYVPSVTSDNTGPVTTLDGQLTEARALVRELVEALQEIDEMPDEPPPGNSCTQSDWLAYARARQQAIARSARLKARASGYTEEGE